MTKSDSGVEVRRETNETNICVRLSTAGSRTISISTGIGFLDHMLTSLAFWAGWDLDIECQGDLHVDQHHTVEDVALALGRAFHQATKERSDLERFGWALAPLDESLAQVAVDLGGRPYLVYDAPISVARTGDFDTYLTRHFLRSFVTEARINLNLQCKGTDPHHQIESMFKGLALALRQALQHRPGDSASTKGQR